MNEWVFLIPTKDLRMAFTVADFQTYLMKMGRVDKLNLYLDNVAGLIHSRNRLLRASLEDGYKYGIFLDDDWAIHIPYEEFVSIVEKVEKEKCTVSIPGLGVRENLFIRLKDESEDIELEKVRGKFLEITETGFGCLFMPLEPFKDYQFHSGEKGEDQYFFLETPEIKHYVYIPREGFSSHLRVKQLIINFSNGQMMLS